MRITVSMVEVGESSEWIKDVEIEGSYKRRTTMEGKRYG